MVPDRRGSFGAAAVVSALFTLLLIQWSFDRFRLAGPPFVDDVTWMNEGLAMLDAARDGGLPEFIRHVADSRTLEPYAVVSAVGFGLAGVHDWVPYAMNGGLIFCLLAFLELQRRRADLSPWMWFPAVALVLAFPIAGYSVVSFIGDHSAGLFIALGSIAFLEGWPLSESRLESWSGTIAWICAFFTKATLFPEAALMFGVSAGLGCWIGRRESGQWRTQRWLTRGLVVVALTAPYYWLVSGEIYAYLTVHNFGALHDVWAFHGSTAESLLFYLTGYSGASMLGPALYLALALVFLQILILLRAATMPRLQLAGLAILLLIAYAMPTSLANKTFNVGAPLQFSIALSAVRAFYAIAARFRVAGVALACVLPFVFQFPGAYDRVDSPAVASRTATMNALVAALQAEQVQASEPVFLTTAGFVSVNSLKYQFRKRNLPVPDFADDALNSDPGAFQAMIDRVNYVIATEPGHDEVFYTLPAAYLQQRTLAMVAGHPDFVEVARFRSWRGKYMILFGRRNRVRHPAPAGAEPVREAEPAPLLLSGFTAPGGDQSRWTRGDFDIEFPAPRGREAQLTVRYLIPQTHLEKTGPIHMTARVDREGEHTETVTQQADETFVYRYAIREQLVSTVRVHFHLSGTVPGPDGKPLGILFHSATLEPVPEAAPSARLGPPFGEQP